MRAICQNANDWLQTARANNRLLNNIYQNFNSKAHIFGYDLNAQKTRRRGDAMCPRNWKKSNPCPQQKNGVNVQPEIMPDFWYSTSKEFLNPLNENEIVAEYDIDPSKPSTDPNRFV